MGAIDGIAADLGPWIGADLAGTALSSIGIGADEGLPDDVRFVAGVAKLIRKRIAMGGIDTNEKQPAIFLLEPAPRTYKPDVTPKREPMLDSGLTSVGGRLWFLSPVVVTGSYVRIEASDDDELFRIVTDALKLGDVPAIIFDPRTSVPQVRFYPEGLGKPEHYEPVPVNVTDVSLARIFEAIDRVHEELLITPEAQEKAGKLWEDNAKWWPSKEAEGLVQLYLRTGLTMAFPTCTVRSEQTSAPGRLDLEIEETDPLDSGHFTRHAVLELKVLRSFGSTGEKVSEEYTLGWIASGVTQAFSYRDKRSALAAALCCFDMRCVERGDRCFDHVADEAKRLDVKLRSWFIYATSKQYRDALANSHKS